MMQEHDVEQADERERQGRGAALLKVSERAMPVATTAQLVVASRARTVLR